MLVMIKTAMGLGMSTGLIVEAISGGWAIGGKELQEHLAAMN